MVLERIRIHTALEMSCDRSVLLPLITRTLSPMCPALPKEGHGRRELSACIAEGEKGCGSSEREYEEDDEQERHETLRSTY